MKFRVYRSNPVSGERDRYDVFEIVPREKMSVLDALMAIREEQDPTIGFRYSCRAGMCGSCAMMVNGVPRRTCRTPLARLNTRIVTIEPLRYLPVVKDLAVDMSPLFEKLRRTIPHVVPKSQEQEPAIIRPTEPGRVRIADYLECIGCGCCYAGCGLPALDPDYLGPHALNRVYTLIHDRRDAARDDRLEIADGEHGCRQCHTQTSCMDVCPKEIGISDAIQDLKREVLAYRRDMRFVPEAAEIPQTVAEQMEVPRSPARRDLLCASALGAVGVVALAVGVPIAGAALSPALRRGETEEWSDLGPVEDFPVGKMVEKRYQASPGGFWFDRTVRKTAYVLRRDEDTVQVLSPSCPHLGCPVRWSETSRRFICPCHGGIFDESGKNVGGPPKNPLDQLDVRARNGRVYVKEPA